VRRATGGIYRAAERPWRARPGRKSGVIPGRVSRLAVARPGEAGETTGPTSGPGAQRDGGGRSAGAAEAGADRCARAEWRAARGRSWALGRLRGGCGKSELAGPRGKGKEGWAGRAGALGQGGKKGRWERESGLGPGRRWAAVERGKQRTGLGPGRGLGWWASGMGFGSGWVWDLLGLLLFLFLFTPSFLFLIQTKFEFKYKFEFKPHSNN